MSLATLDYHLQIRVNEFFQIKLQVLIFLNHSQILVQKSGIVCSNPTEGNFKRFQGLCYWSNWKIDLLNIHYWQINDFLALGWLFRVIISAQAIKVFLFISKKIRKWVIAKRSCAITFTTICEAKLFTRQSRLELLFLAFPSQFSVSANDRITGFVITNWLFVQAELFKDHHYRGERKVCKQHLNFMICCKSKRASSWDSFSVL